MIPFRTDAPIYHWPVATVGLIVVNVAVFGALLGVSPEADPWWVLSHGDGLHPIQWVTSNFVHANVGHLIGNMIYLWAFGLVVEGKTGAFRFLLIYLGLGILQCALEQAVMLGAAEGGSLGASAIIYGLLAMALVWAPRNEFSVVVFWRFSPHIFDLPIIVFASLYFLIEFVTVAVSRFSVGSSLLHLSGALLGFLLGSILVKTGLVDCEGWDLYSVGARGRPATSAVDRRKKREKSQAEARQEQADDRSAEALSQLRAWIGEGDAPASLAAYHRLTRFGNGGHRPVESDLLALIKLLHRDGLQKESVPIMETYIDRHPDKSARIRLKLAQILIRDQQRPTQALRILADISESDLTADLVPIRRQLEAQANRLIQEGVLELEGESW
jgi:membrane associated rhomboid family serine protease